MPKNGLVSPVLKWVGGKRQLLDSILPLVPEKTAMYCEPFLGGGAVLFASQPEHAIVNDLNSDLMLVYRVIRDNVDDLVESLRGHENTREYFYALRNVDRDRAAYSRLSDVEKASRIIYLNKTCYNGLYRVNASGEFNSPYGRFKNPNIVNEDVLRAVHKYLTDSDIQMFSEDFAGTLARVPEDGFVYLDPPYDPVSETASFTGYSKGGFARSDQQRLKECCDELTARGVKFLLSNSDTPFIQELYADYTIGIVSAKRAINSNASKRGAVQEVLIRNYEP